MISIHPADRAATDWACKMVAAHHYLRKAPDRRSRPFCYVVRAAQELVGCLFFGRPESTRCFAGGLTYGSIADVASGRAAFDRWEILNLSRVWLSPDVQPGGRLCTPGSPVQLPGFFDRHGIWRPALASFVVRTALARIGFDYLQAHPPCFPDQPFEIRSVLSYCDTRLHRGTIYQASGFNRARKNADGIETWWTPAVAPLTEDQRQSVLQLAEVHPRSLLIRNRERSLFA